jgi:hypothetical protein
MERQQPGEVQRGAQAAQAGADKLQKVHDEFDDIGYRILHIGGTLRATAERVKEITISFFPGYVYQPDTLISVVMTMVIASIWLLVYFQFCYQPDRKPVAMVPKWETALQAIDSAEPYGDFNPDVIMVFHHPSFAYEDADEEISADQINDVMVASEEVEDAFHDLVSAKNLACNDAAAMIKRKFQRASRKALESARSISSQISLSSVQETSEADERLSQSDDGEVNHLTVKAARKALLTDLYKHMHKQGFDMTAFSSIDSDEIFICASLKSRNAINHYLSQSHRALPLRPEVVACLQDQHKPVLQDPTDPSSTPPLIPYEPPLVKTLMEKDVITEESETCVFKTFKRFGVESYISSNVAIQTMLAEVSEVLDLDAAVEHGMIVSWYPVHNARELDRFGAIWGNWKALMDLSFAQPISDIQDYFGARVAFLFAWNGVYCKALGLLLMASVFWLLTTTIARYVFKTDFFNERQVIGFAITLCVWCKVALNMWRREEGFFLELWGMRNGMLDSGHAVRASFHGEMGPSPMNANIQEKQFSKSKAYLHRALTNAATLLYCFFVLCVIWTWMILYRGKFGMMSAMMLSIGIKVFQIVFHLFVHALVEFENHKFHEDYFNSYLLKLFVFEYVNNYSAFFFLTLSNSDESTCQGDQAGCKIATLKLLRSQVSMTLFILIICSIVQVVVNIVLVKFKLFWEDYQFRKNFGKEPPPRSSHEEQAKLAKIDEATEVQNMMTLVMALGFVFHFGGVSPLALVFTFILFAVQLRAFAKICLSAQRVVPHRSQGIGMWGDILNFLMISGVVYTSFLVVVYGAAFGEASKMAKMSAFILLLVGIFLSWLLVDFFYPSEDHQVALLHDRRNYVSKLLMKL